LGIAWDYGVDLAIAVAVLVSYVFDGEAGGIEEDSDVVAVAVFGKALDPGADPASFADGDGVYGEGVAIAGSDEHDLAGTERHVDGDAEGLAEVAIGEAEADVVPTAFEAGRQAEIAEPGAIGLVADEEGRDSETGDLEAELLAGHVCLASAEPGTDVVLLAGGEVDAGGSGVGYGD
jgi:hypothetical protein